MFNIALWGGTHFKCTACIIRIYDADFEYQDRVGFQPSRKLRHFVLCEVTSYSWPMFPFQPLKELPNMRKEKITNTQKLSRCLCSHRKMSHTVSSLLMFPSPLHPVSVAHLYPIWVIKQTRRWCVWAFRHSCPVLLSHCRVRDKHVSLLDPTSSVFFFFLSHSLVHYHWKWSFIKFGGKNLLWFR